ncbi:hypothetical protein BJY01DRAFT_248885 [Aspergillus pseudoustus]|uniref:BZIP domain-containing protein n=1 Tax=Aspergillus pseudoustus TaxID=1810923 RepID=A0ABR4JSA5_9EURO
MYCHTSHGTSASASFYSGGLTLDTPYGHDDQQHDPQWDTSSIPLLGDTFPLPSPISPPTRTPGGAADDYLSSHPSVSSTSTPQMPEGSVRDSQHPSPTEADALPNDDDGGIPPKAKVRRSQNRQAQRRFRERRQEQNAALLTRLDELQSRHDEIAARATSLKQENCALATEKTRLTREVELLRRWRRKLHDLMYDLVQQDKMASDLANITRGCPDTCWRRGVEYSRLLITMQTLLSLFEELQIAPEGAVV